MSQANTKLLIDLINIGQIDDVQTCIYERKYNINVSNKYGWTPLMAAVDQNRYAIVEVLVNSGAKILVKDSFEQKLIITRAKEKGYLGIYEYLSEHLFGEIKYDLLCHLSLMEDQWLRETTANQLLLELNGMMMENKCNDLPRYIRDIYSGVKLYASSEYRTPESDALIGSVHPDRSHLLKTLICDKAFRYMSKGC